ncbi:MAG: hypothetical protein LBF72_02575 [Holosporales bacterium]|nr:hypothetical protein [Holosporales bacterium]
MLTSHKYAALLRDVSPARKLSMTGYTLRINSHQIVTMGKTSIKYTTKMVVAG